MEEARYSYSPLQRHLREIRLLVVLQGAWSDDVFCRLENVPLDEQPEYEAVSYVWGDFQDKRLIKLNEYSFPVTSNLESALRHLRRPSSERTLWVDAICIDQSSPVERS